MSMLEKTIWSFKKMKEEDLSNENIEAILNFYDSSKFELNYNVFKSQFKIDLDEVFQYPSVDHEKVQNDIENCFKSNYHHSLFTGKYTFDDKDQTISLEVEKIFTNEDHLYNSSNEFLICKYDNENIVFSRETIIVDIINRIKSEDDKVDELKLTLQNSYKK